MATYEFQLPDIGEGVMEGEIVKWLVKAGDSVQEDQALVEVMTDKATVTVPSPKAGKVLKTHGLEGEVARVHHALVTLELETGTSAPAPSPSSSPVPPAQVPTNVAAAPTPSVATSQKVLATPVTRRMAREHGLNLMEIPGTGPQGRVTKVDVEAVLSAGNGAVANGQQELATNGTARTPPAPLSSGAKDTRVPLRGLRKKIAEKMVRSKFTAPHFTFVEELDATGLVEMRKRLNAALTSAGEDLKISFLPFICKALVAALKKYPSLNANMDEAKQELIVRGEYNLGIAVATEDGLTVPVVKHVDRLTLRELSLEITRLGKAAREKKLKMEELSQGTFTITSLGQTGGLFATPIINHPEVAILGVHRMRKRPVVVNDAIVVREMLHLSLSFDHRVIDGSMGAEFTYAVIRYLENPEALLLEMA